MKRLFSWLGTAIGIAAILVGCGSSSYSIFDRQEGTGVKSVHVTIPSTATTTDMQGWAQEIEASEKVAGKDFMVVFYNGGERKASSIMGTYEDGTLSSVSEADRQEAAREGD